MLKIDSRGRTLVPLGEGVLRRASFFARYQIRNFLINSPTAFFGEVGREFFLFGENVSLGESMERRVDFLALEASGRLELIFSAPSQSRGDIVNALEAMSRAALWSRHEVAGRLTPERAAELGRFLTVEFSKVNRSQGALLIAESFSPDAVSMVRYLRERYGIAIACLRLEMTVDTRTGLDYLSLYELTKDAAAETAGEAAEIEPAGSAEKERLVIAVEREADRKTEHEAPRRAAEAEAQPAEPQPAKPAPAEPLPADDPLAEVIEVAAEAAGPIEAVVMPARERRALERGGEYQARRLRLDYFGRLMGARLIDFSREGLGVETLSPLPVGARVKISGELIGREGLLAIEGRAKVRHCRPLPNGVCRVGFSLAEARLSEMEAVEAFDRR